MGQPGHHSIMKLLRHQGSSPLSTKPPLTLTQPSSRPFTKCQGAQVCLGPHCCLAVSPPHWERLIQEGFSFILLLFHFDRALGERPYQKLSNSQGCCIYQIPIHLLTNSLGNSSAAPKEQLPLRDPRFVFNSCHIISTSLLILVSTGILPTVQKSGLLASFLLFK